MEIQSTDIKPKSIWDKNNKYNIKLVMNATKF